MDGPALPAPTSRPRRGRLLGGVCAGLAARWSLPVGGVRLGVAASALLVGLGVIAYAAAWLFLPSEGDDPATPGTRGIVTLAQVAGAVAGLATLGLVAALATTFGFGWVVVALGAAILVGALLQWPRVGPGWALLPLGALVLPSVALAASGVQIDPQTASRTVAPPDAAALSAAPLRSGLGRLTIDLRRTRLPRTGVVPVRIDAGVARTIVALPHDRCVRVELRQDEVPTMTRIATALAGRGLDTRGATVFGRPTEADRVVSPGDGAGPTLRLEVTSDGGSLVVRDFPDDIDPRHRPDWPGYEVFPEERPDTTGMSRAEARRIVRAWGVRRREQDRDRRRIDRLLPGPCATPADAQARR